MPTAGSRSCALAPDLVRADRADQGRPGARRAERRRSGSTPLPSPDGGRFSHIAVHDGQIDLVVAPIGGGPGQAIQPWPGVWRAIGWLGDGGAVAGDRRERAPPAGPLAAAGAGNAAGEPERPAGLTEFAAGRPAPVALGRAGADPVQGPRRPADRGEPVAAGRGHRPARPAGQRFRRSSIAHGGPTWQQRAALAAVQAAPRPGGLCRPRRRLPGLDRLRPRVPRGESWRMGPCRRVRLHRCRALARASRPGATAGWPSTAARTAAT